MRLKRYYYPSRREDVIIKAAQGRMTPEDANFALMEFQQKDMHGWSSAEPIVRGNKIEDATLAGLVQKHAIPYSEFQQMNLYHAQGFFETNVDFTWKNMPLFPQALSPFFGRVIAELLFSAYVPASWPAPQEPTFLSLGAGAGYLDYDMIDYYTGDKFSPDNQTQRFYHAVRTGSRFIVSDRTDRAIGLLHEQLDGLVKERDVSERVDIRKINALDFQLERQPFGIVYSNELLDNLPIEPIVRDGGKDYQVYLIPYTEGPKMTEGEYQTKLGERFTLLDNRVLTRDEFESKAVSGRTGDIKFHPVLVPLGINPELQANVSSLESFRQNMGNQEVGNIYPYQIGLGRVLDNIRKSFDHGVVLFIDYEPSNRGGHNWNQAINTFRNLRFGEEDLDFQIDFSQVVEEARKRGMGCKFLEPQRKVLEQFVKIVGTFGGEEIARWHKANNAKMSSAETATNRAAMIYAGVMNLVSGFHKIAILQF